MTEKTSIITRYPEDRSLEEDIGRWWVLHVKPNCEKMVANYLLHREVSYYLPILKQKVRYGNLGRVRTMETPLFRGYVCLALDKTDHGVLYGTKKLVRIMEVEDQQGFVDELNAVARAIETQEYLAVHPGLVPGKEVRILSGPLQGLEGILVQRKADKQLALSVKMFSQTVLVKLDPFTKLEPS
jgi:transcription antitermination factor NusG